MLTNRILLLIVFFIVTVSSYSQTVEIKLANEYFKQGEFEKAKGLYDELIKDRRNIITVNANYIEVLKQIGEQREIEKYFSQILKWYPGNINYQVAEVSFFFELNDEKNFKRGIQDLKNQYGENRFQLSMIGQQLANKRMYQQSADFFLMARQASGIASSYALEVARIYSLLNEKQKMVDEYLTYAMENRQHANYIKNIFQNLLKDEDDLTYLQSALIERMQNEPAERTYPDLMIWLELQRKNFYGAFVQARALDKREQTNGNQTLRVGRIAIDNESWNDAITIFTYLTKSYHETPSQSYYRKLLIESKEGQVKSTFPIDRTAIKSLSKEYKQLYDE